MSSISRDRFARIYSCISMGTILIVLLLICATTPLMAQNDTTFEEIDITLNVPRVGATELPSLIFGQDLYLSVPELFAFLKIKYTLDEKMDSITGYVLGTDNPFLINRNKMCIEYKKQTFNLQPNDLIRTETSIYLKSNHFGEIFGIYFSFNSKTLSATLDTKIELPVFNETKQALTRSNINKLKGETRVDSTITQTRPTFKPGMLDWNLSSSQQSNKKEYSLGIKTGVALAGGAAELNLNYQSNQPQKIQIQHYLWKYVNNDHKYLKQTMLGNISTNSIASFFKPAIGLQLTNTSTNFRRSFGTYKLSDVTQPNWTVELYINNILTDYTKADASGFFSFDIPLVYGNSDVSLRFYGTWGEEQKRKINITIPYNFLPKKELEYTMSVGFIPDSLNSKLARAEFNYGLSSRITIGGGSEYLSSLSSGKNIPFLTASFRLWSRFLLSSEYNYGVQSKTTLSYDAPGLQAELQYILFDRKQKAIQSNYLEDRSLSINMPIRLNKNALLSRMTLHQLIMPNLQSTTAQLSLSLPIFGIGNSVMTNHQINKQNSIEKTLTSSIFSQTYRLPAKFNISHQTQYDYNQKKIIQTRIESNRPLFKHSFISLVYEKNFLSKNQEFEIGFRTDLTFAQTSFSARRNNNHKLSFTESAAGSFYYDGSTRYLGTNYRKSVGKGGITLVTFLDINGNEIYDKGEPKVERKNLTINGGRLSYDAHDTVLRITELEPYRAYIISQNLGGFNNISWRIKNMILSVTVDPNILKVIEVPVFVAGEASGMVYNMSGKQKTGLGRINIQFQEEDGSVTANTLTEGDGYFSFLGLRAGNYVVQIDTSQLNKLGMIASPPSIPFSIKTAIDGDMIEDLNFTLHSKAEIISTASKIGIPTKEEKITDTVRAYFVQIGAFRSKVYATKMLKKCQAFFPYPLIVVKENGLFKVRAGYFKTLSETKDCYQWMIDMNIESTMGVLENGKLPFIVLENNIYNGLKDPKR